MQKLVCAAGLVAFGLAACGGDDGNDVAPAIIVGGGIHDPGIDGEVNVYVTDEDTDAPLAGATVKIGAIEGTTDAAGLFTASGDLVGKQTIVVKAAGHASAMWVGADGANVTIPLTKSTTTTPDVPQAELAGTVAGWGALPFPIANHVTAVLVSYSADRDLNNDDGNNLAPPAMNSNICVQGPAPAPRSTCAWRINARAGTIALAGMLVDLDSKGTATEADDTLAITNFAVKDGVTVVDGANQTGISLDLLASGSTTTASVSFGTPPAAFTNVGGVVGIDLGASGVLRLGQVSPTQTSVVMPSLSAVPGATGYEFLGFASEPVTDGTDGQSVVLRRGITSASGIAAGEWLNAPGGLASDRASVSFTHVAGAFAHVIEIDTNSGSGTGNRAMSIIVLDDTASVTLPVDFAPLPSGALQVTANAFDAGAGFAADDFEIETLLGAIQRLAGETTNLN